MCIFYLVFQWWYTSKPDIMSLVGTVLDSDRSYAAYAWALWDLEASGRRRGTHVVGLS